MMLHTDSEGSSRERLEEEFKLIRLPELCSMYDPYQDVVLRSNPTDKEERDAADYTHDTDCS